MLLQPTHVPHWICICHKKKELGNATFQKLTAFSPNKDTHKFMAPLNPYKLWRIFFWYEQDMSLWIVATNFVTYGDSKPNVLSVNTQQYMNVTPTLLFIDS